LTRLAIQPATAVLQSADLRTAWQASLECIPVVDRLFQSPEWVEHLISGHGRNDIEVAICWDETGHPAAFIPLWLNDRPLVFEIGGRRLGRPRLPVWQKSGSFPPGLPTVEMIEKIVERDPKNSPNIQGLFLKTQSAASPWWSPSRPDAGSRSLLTYEATGVFRRHLIQIPDTLDAYLASLSAITRKGLKRQLRRIQQVGSIELRRIESTDQVPGFLSDADRISRNTWQHRRIGRRIRKSENHRRVLSDLAARGLLRSYVLYLDNQPCAFSIGFQINEVFHDSEVGFDRQFARFSPGNVLLMKMLEDLISHRRPVFYDFGEGDARYKAQLGNTYRLESNVMVMRPTWRNRAWFAVHESFRSWTRRARAAIAAFRTWVASVKAAVVVQAPMLAEVGIDFKALTIF